MRRLGVGKTIVLLITLVGLAACTRSLVGPCAHRRSISALDTHRGRGNVDTGRHHWRNRDRRRNRHPHPDHDADDHGTGCGKCHANQHPGARRDGNIHDNRAQRGCYPIRQRV